MMKKLLGTLAFVGLAAGLALTLPPRPAHAALSQVPVIRTVYEKLGTAAGAAITSPVAKLDNCDEVSIFADNSAGAASRTLNIDWLGSDGTTILYRVAVTVTNATRAGVNISQRASSATASSGGTTIPLAPGNKMQFTLASAGAAAGSLAVYCR